MVDAVLIYAGLEPSHPVSLTDHVVDNVEAAAGSLVGDWFKKYAKAIALLPEADRSRYARIQSESKEPARRPGIIIDGTISDAVSIQYEPDATDEQVREHLLADASNRWSKHLYQDADGKYWKKPTSTDGLERTVLRTELDDEDLVAWYRNPTGGDRALCIPYWDSGTNTWARLFPDFVTFHLVGNEIMPAIIDPHGIQLEDWEDKLVGYLDYADEHAGLFRAIWPITQIEGKPRLLSLHDGATRHTVRAALSAGESVESIFRAHGIDY